MNTEIVHQKVILIFTVIIVVMSTQSCSKKTLSTAQSITQENSKAAQKKPYLILISLDGFRWDYIEKYNPPNLSSFINNGVKAQSLIPSFPTKTFPNHYTIATGLYPDKHGILGNVFYDYNTDTIYDIKNREMVEDGRFYGGSPIWLHANKENMVTASYFFVGTEADVQGVRPTYYYKFDESIEKEVRINQAIEWLNLPEKSRPHLITLYFGDLDKTGHQFGPNKEDEIEKALLNLDKHLGKLFTGISETKLPVNIIIVSDHGMYDQATANLIPTELIENDELYFTIDNGSIANIHPKENVELDSVLNYLREKEDHFKTYDTANTPGFEYSPESENWGPIQLIPDFGYYFLSQRRKAALINKGVTSIGVHGFDSKHKEMHGIFYANGPAFKHGYEIPSIKNIHIYPLMCKILGLEIPKNIDGDINQINNVLNTSSNH